VFPRSESLIELWHYRELLWFLAWRDIKVRYKQTILGAAWAVLQPLLGTLAFSAVFTRLGVSSHVGVPYPLFTYCALLPWTYFSATLVQGGNSLVTHSRLLTKVYFPRVLLPASVALSGLLDFAVGSGVLLALMVYYGVRPGWTIVLVPFVVIAMWLVTLAISMFLAALNVRYRDVRYAIPFLVQLGLFLTPIIYPITALSGRVQRLAALNPIAAIVESLRACLFPQHQVAPGLLLESSAVALAICALSALYFHATERMFADIV